MNQEKLIFDRNYNVIDRDVASVYKDELFELTDELVQKRKQGLLDDGEFRLLMRVLLRKTLHKEVKTSFRWLTKKKSKTNILVKYTEFEKKYV